MACLVGISKCTVQSTTRSRMRLYGHPWPCLCTRPYSSDQSWLVAECIFSNDTDCNKKIVTLKKKKAGSGVYLFIDFIYLYVILHGNHLMHMFNCHVLQRTWLVMVINIATLVSRSQTLTPKGRESGKVLYTELSQCLVEAHTIRLQLFGITMVTRGCKIVHWCKTSQVYWNVWQACAARY